MWLACANANMQTVSWLSVCWPETASAALLSSDVGVILITAGRDPTIVSSLCRQLCVCVSFTMNYPEGEMDCVNVAFEARTWICFVMSPLRPAC